jgi:hypothetical protein
MFYYLSLFARSRRCNLSFANAQALGGHRKHSSAHHNRVLQLAAGSVDPLPSSMPPLSQSVAVVMNTPSKKRARGLCESRVDGGWDTEAVTPIRLLRSKTADSGKSCAPLVSLLEITSPERESILLSGPVDGLMRKNLREDAAVPQQTKRKELYNNAQRQILMGYLQEEVCLQVAVHVCVCMCMCLELLLQTCFLNFSPRSLHINSTP